MTIPDRDVLRLLDANLNRAVEGVRVMEETARMLLDDLSLTSELKNQRHNIVHHINNDSHLKDAMMMSRGSDRDVLRSGNTESESSRPDVLSIVMANAGRAQEALRAIEEFVKLTHPVLSADYKSIRFRLYDLEKSLVLKIKKKLTLDKDHIGILLVLESLTKQSADLFMESIRKYTKSGSVAVGLSDPAIGDRLFIDSAAQIIEYCRENDVVSFIYNRLDCAMILNADGVLLNNRGLTAKECRKAAGEGIIVGYLAEAHSKIQSQEVDFLIIDTKGQESEDKPDLLRRVISEVNLPVLVSGLETQLDRRACIELGVSGFVVPANTANSGFIRQMIREWEKPE